MKVLVRCDASRSLGLGHIVRCLALAEELRETQGAEVLFVTRQDPISAALLRERRFATAPADLEVDDPDRWLLEVVSALSPSALVIDVRDSLSGDALDEIRALGVVVATIDDGSERRLHADLAFSPPLEQALAADRSGAVGRAMIGWEWVLLRRDLQAFRGRRRGRGPGEASLLVTMGGSDPGGLIFEAIEAIALVASELAEIKLIVGAGFEGGARLEEQISRLGLSEGCRVLSSPPDLPRLMAEADLALASFGVTAYELAALGVPSVVVALTPDHATSARALAEAGALVSLGLHSEVEPRAIALALRDLIVEIERREAIGRRGAELIDGRGAERMALEIARSVEGPS